ncbi:MAG: ABC transporter ATP-binding protein [Caldilineaceae bacterium]|nr:ABC transporter ATP-binding protein [Caldilineaceae bacterium]MBP8109562.1 ABC transporter ATP-binding protein [Caldilineaceae bacterium]MBP8124062.1 ABC transporter ATP-binding protein [Caldilineaceae bacterium]MBP9074569.1 ABC transporter ATP-binding protein [Caldilineaceae bacterium]
MIQQSIAKPEPSGPLRRLLRYARPHRRAVILASTYSILNKVFDLAPPLLIGAAVDVVVTPQASLMGKLGIEGSSAQLMVLGVITVIVWALESVFQYLYSVAWRNLAQTLQHELRMDAYGHVQGLEMAYFEDRSSGGLMAILNDDINQLERFLDGGANEIYQLVTTVIVIGAIFLYSAPSVTWMAVLPMPFVFWGSLVFQRRLAPRYASVREQVGILNGQLSNNLGGIATIKSFTAEAHESARIGGLSDEYRQRNRAAIVLSSAFVPLIRMVIVVGFTSIMVFGGRLVITGQLNVGVYSVLVFLTQRLLWPLTRMGETLDLYQRAMASTSRVLDVLDTQPGMVEGKTTLPAQVAQGDVAFENISFEYGTQFKGDQQTVIQNLTMRIPAGETAAIVGATGSGKSTLVKLLLRFYDVQQGAITLDGHDIRDLRMASLRGAIGFVSQDVFLFHGTVRENIAYGTFDATDAQIVDAARVAEAHDFILTLPHGYDTIVGERGQKLSGGQRQRLSIARAVLKDPPVLILDEATSAVDNETEAAIQRSMERITVGRTTIVIAHRLSTVRNADQIFVLEKGQLKEQGRHEALVAEGGVYAGLWRVQTGEKVKG